MAQKEQDNRPGHLNEHGSPQVFSLQLPHVDHQRSIADVLEWQTIGQTDQRIRKEADRDNQSRKNFYQEVFSTNKPQDGMQIDRARPDNKVKSGKY